MAKSGDGNSAPAQLTRESFKKDIPGRVGEKLSAKLSFAQAPHTDKSANFLFVNVNRGCRRAKWFLRPEGQLDLR